MPGRLDFAHGRRNPELFFGTPSRELVEAVRPSVDDVVLPPTTLRALNHALALVRKHESLIFHQWGLARAAFHHRARPGLTIRPDRRHRQDHLRRGAGLRPRQAAPGGALLELERWVRGRRPSAWPRSSGPPNGRTRSSSSTRPSCTIAGRRFTAVNAAYEREADAVVSVLLNELEHFPGVVIFATNLAANIDPAFERRTHAHILFEMPDAAARNGIRRSPGLHSRKTPLADDVDFADLAARYPRSGGDVENAVLKAAQIATTKPGPDANKRPSPASLRPGDRGGDRGRGDHGAVVLTGRVRLRRPESWSSAEEAGAAPAELGIVAERLEALDDRQAGLSKAHAEVLERLRTPAAPSRAPVYLGAAALVAALAALVLSLIG